MKKIILAAALAIAPTLAVADATGTWKTQPGDNGGWLHVEIYSCGANTCGKIAKAFDNAGAAVAGYEHAGKVMIKGMKSSDGKSYSGGTIWRADNNKTYKSKMSLSGSKLKVSGCVAGGLVCSGQTWTKVN